MNFDKDLKTGATSSAFVDGTFAMRLSDNRELLFIQNLTKNTSSINTNLSNKYYGVGFGTKIKFGKSSSFIAVVDVQNKGTTLNLSFNR